jgi:hypothetical protein
MKQHNESDIIFEYDERICQCVKFDENVAYKKVSDRLSTKGIDFLLIEQNKKLIFVEVKNFIGHTFDSNTKERLENKADELMTEIALKVRDTISCTTSAARQSTNEPAFWKLCNQIFLDSRTKILIIAWIELDKKFVKENKAKMGMWSSKLKTKLNWLHSTAISINNIDNPPPISLTGHW